MATDNRRFIAKTFGPNGVHLASLELPPTWTVRWTARLKADVVRAVNTGRLSFDEASERYALTREEFRGWEIAYDALHRRDRHVDNSHPDVRTKRNASLHVH